MTPPAPNPDDELFKQLASGPASERAADAVAAFTRNRMWRLPHVPAEYHLPRPGMEASDACLLKALYRELALRGYIALDETGEPCVVTARPPKIPHEPEDEFQAAARVVAEHYATRDRTPESEAAYALIEYACRGEVLRRKVLWALAQKFYDVCWLDLYRELGTLVGVAYTPELLPRDQFPANCKRYHDSLATGCPYTKDDHGADAPDRPTEPEPGPAG